MLKIKQPSSNDTGDRDAAGDMKRAARLALRESQLESLRKALTLTSWAGVCDVLPAARDWFDDEGKLR